MSRTLAFLTATRGGARLHWSDWASYSYLFLGVFLMFFPVIWLVLSSFKTEADLQRYPPTFLPYQQQTITLEGHADPLPLFQITAASMRARSSRSCAAWACAHRWSTRLSPRHG